MFTQLLQACRRRWLLSGGSLLLLLLGSLTCYIYIDFRLIRTVHGHADTVFALEYSPDGKWLASGSFDSTVSLWEVSTGNRVKSFQTSRPVSSLCFLPDQQGLVYADGTSATWVSLPDGASKHSFALPGNNNVLAVSASRDGQRIAVAGGIMDFPFQGDAISTGVISIWDLTTNQFVEPVRSFSKVVSCCVISPDGQRIAYTLENDGFLAEIGSELAPKTIEWGRDYCFTLDGKSLIIEQQGYISHYDMEKEQVVCKVLYGNNMNLVSGSGITLSPDGTRLARATLMGELMTWRHAGVQVLSSTDLSLITAYHSNDNRYGSRGNSMASVAISPDGKQVAGGSECGKIHIWNLPR